MANYMQTSACSSEELRRRAEIFIDTKADSLAKVFPQDIQKLVHELSVHQIELEMQNEELRTAQAELLDARDKYSDLYDFAPVGYFILTDKGMIAKANLTGANLLGAERGQLTRQAFSAYVITEDQDDYYRFYRRLMESQESGYCELRLKRTDGHTFHVNVSGYRAGVATDSGFGIRLCVTDITECKQAEDAIRRSSLYSRSLIEASLDSLIIINANGKITDANAAAERVTGVLRDKMIGSDFCNYFTVPDKARAVYNEVFACGYVIDYPLSIRHQAGEITHVLFNASVYKDENGLAAGVIAAARDITEIKQAEAERLDLEGQIQQAQKLESLGVLAGGIAHDFNNILMAILWNAELALDEIPPTSAACERMTQIMAAGNRAAELCSQMMAYSGKASFVSEPVDLRGLIEETAHLLETSISKKAIINLSLMNGLPPIQGDPSQLRQTVMNLIINASDAIGEQDGVINVSLSLMDCDEGFLRNTEMHDDLTPGSYVCLEVSDTGCGMDAETKARVFEPFFTTKLKGHGLGLAAVLGIVKMHKGALRLVSEPGKGTTFGILFPSADRVQRTISERPFEISAKCARPTESSSAADSTGKGVVLLVDDEEMLRTSGSKMLIRMGFTVMTAADGLAAVDLYRDHGADIDIVILDLVMPRMGGVEAFDELYRLNSGICVVVASGHTSEDIATCFKGKSPAAFLQKPYTTGKLKELLEGLIMKRKGQNGPAGDLEVAQESLEIRC